MRSKKRKSSTPFDFRQITMDDLLRVFLSWEDRLQAQRMREGPPDPNLPRVPYKVEQVESKSGDEIAHFHYHYKNPSEILGKLTLKRPDQWPRNKKAKLQ